jgi:hypothetical protein
MDWPAFGSAVKNLDSWARLARAADARDEVRAVIPQFGPGDSWRARRYRNPAP